MPASVLLTIQAPPRRFFAHRALLRRTILKRWICAALFAPAEITVRFVGSKEGIELNQTYRGKPYATNVLSFSYDSELPSMHETRPKPALSAKISTNHFIRGDIVLCCPVIAKEAQEQHKTLEAHYAHLIIHGVLHLQGYDHQNDEDATIMEAIETRLLIQLGFEPVY